MMRNIACFFLFFYISLRLGWLYDLSITHCVVFIEVLTNVSFLPFFFFID
jgi:hypothetical protein